MKPLFILGHLGKGDHLLTNGLTRVLADRHGSVIVPCYPHNLADIKFMFRDDPRIQVVECQNSTHACGMAVAHGNSLKLGYYSDHKFDPRFFDREFYSQANVEFKDRWEKFYIAFDFPSPPIQPGTAFIHYDRDRNFVISMDHMPKGIPFVVADKSRPFFDWVPQIQSSEEIHVINSSFLILIDSLPEIEGQKLFFHRYPRPTDYPTLRKAWAIIEK